MSIRTFLLLLLAMYVNCDEMLHTNHTPKNLMTVNNVSETKQIDKSLSVCTSESCSKESAIILTYLDENADPCGDFYEFACGKYLRETVHSADQSSGTLFSELQNKISEQLVEILTEELQFNEPHAIQLPKRLMKMCMNDTMRDEQGIAPMVEILERYGGWPVVNGDKWDAGSWNWLDIQKRMFDDGFTDNLVLEISFGPYHKNSSKNVLNVSFLRCTLSK